MSYEIKLEIFEGPMDLLLSLIKENEIDIYDIPIGYLTEKYLEYIYTMQKLNLDISTEFLYMASTLLEIKSKMLLPTNKSAEEEENQDELSDPRDELVEKLLEYESYLNAASSLREFETISSKLCFRDSEEIFSIFKDDGYANLDSEKLVIAMNKMVSKRVKAIDGVKKDIVKVEKFSTREAIASLLERLKKVSKMSFSTFLEEFDSVYIIISYFLAVLELMKQGKISAVQERDFDDILLVRL